MARRKYGKYMALAGAAQGVAQGLSQGMAARWRQAMLEIQEQYRAHERQADRDFRQEGRASEQAFRRELFDARTEIDDKRAREDREHDLSVLQERERMAIGADKRDLQNEIALLDEKSKYKDGATIPADWRSTYIYENATPEERKIYDRVHKIKDEKGAVSAQQLQKYFMNLVSAYAKMDSYDKTLILQSFGKSRVEAKEMLSSEEASAFVIGKYKELIEDAAELMGQAGDPINVDTDPGTVEPHEDTSPIALLNHWTAGGTMPGSQQTAPAPPGSSRDNPLVVGANDPKPPGGTWVKLPDGRIGQLRQDEHQETLRSAREAIAGGADRQAVIQRMRQMGVPDELIGTL